LQLRFCFNTYDLNVDQLRHIHNAGRKQQWMTEVRWCSRDLSTCYHRCEHFGIELRIDAFQVYDV